MGAPVLPQSQLKLNSTGWIGLIFQPTKRTGSQAWVSRFDMWALKHEKGWPSLEKMAFTGGLELQSLARCQAQALGFAPDFLKPSLA